MPLVPPSDPNDNTISPEVFPFDKRFPGGSARNLLTTFQFSHACSIGSGSFFVFSHSATSSTPSSSSMAPSPPSLSLPSLLLSVLSSSNPFLFRSSFAKRSFLASALAFSAALNVSIPVINPRSGLARRRRASLHFKKASGAGSLYSIPNLAARAFALARSFSYSANNSASVATDSPPPPPPPPTSNKIPFGSNTTPGTKAASALRDPSCLAAVLESPRPRPNSILLTWTARTNSWGCT
mmetsp:Transcript_20603/g.31801  ORF Transcript_20603/g.31801 Transcript_20603/m.31801 type:complete len:239 (-) Transcript_20603:139-855(-)